MPLILLGLSYQKTPLAIREQVARHPGSLTVPHVVLSTCNRVEVYAIADELASLQPYFTDVAAEYLYTFSDEAAAQHLFRVAAGLDSMILGEAQILGQVKHAYGQGSGEATLNRLFTQALAVGKRARTETAINRYSISLSQAAVEIARQHFADLPLRRVLIIGAGEMGRKAAYALQGQAQLTLINRTFAKAAELAQQVGGWAVDWEHLPVAIAEADVVITATGAPDSIIQPAHIQHPLLLIDLAVPRDIDPAVRQVPGVRCYDVDDLRQVVDQHYAERLACVPAVEGIIEEELAALIHWQRSRQVTPTITSLHRKMEGLAANELDHLLHQLGAVSTREQQLITQFTHRLVSKMLHTPTYRLKENAAQGVDLSAAVQDLFAL